MNKNQEFFVIRPIYGLANRLRALASSMTLSQEYKKTLYVYWDKSEGFSDESFFSLFSNDTNFQIINKLEFKELKQKSFCFSNILPKLEIVRTENLVYEGFNDLAYLERSNLLNVIPNYRKKFLENLRSLKPCLSVENEASTFSKIFDSQTIGVHIRRGDALQSPYRKKFLQSSDTAFKKIVKKNLDKKVFLASDCKEITKKFKEKFPNILIYNKKFVDSKYGIEKENQKDAFIELLLLSKTSKIFGNNFSSFSMVASAIGNIKLIVVKDK